MNVFLGFLALALLLAALAMGFLRASPARIAAALRLAGPSALGVAGFATMLAGRAGLGGLIVIVATVWFTAVSKRGRAPQRLTGRRSSVRSAAIEMELDHETGALSGTVLAGRHEGRALARMSLDELLSLEGEFAGDGESLQLLEAYLDSRFPSWRERAQADGRRRQRGTPATGRMTKEEAYKVLGLEVGASAAEVRQAHRRLMERLNPEIGGSPLLAARINEARDVLLSDHRSPP